MAGNFFPVDLKVLWKLLTHFRGDEWVVPILAYLVLCKHQQGGKAFTTAGTLVIAKVLGVTRYRAEKLIRELEQVQWGASQEQAIVSHPLLKNLLEMGCPHNLEFFPVKALPRISDECIWLPN